MVLLSQHKQRRFLTKDCPASHTYRILLVSTGMEAATGQPYITFQQYLITIFEKFYFPEQTSEEEDSCTLGTPWLKLKLFVRQGKSLWFVVAFLKWTNI